ncbi:TRAF-like superfamily protein [Striga hermonthica]|uniref:TRAF-like superfamily protein n=1 Tax=Striga hermonthica TaxID=68872 RepID=A0A9N7NX52_STRHE|nr:TRAF-like superfamily protein [Striga hermonthica]
MNPPADDTELTPEKLEEEKEGGASFHCDLYDADIVHKIAEEFLPGLASACVDNTTGGLFRSPASVAVDIRREMVDYLTQRSENFVAESVVLEGGPNIELPEDPYDIISDFIDDFASSKRNFFSRVSGWLLSERREDRIDDFSQEMEIGGFWLLNRRESVAQTILKNADFKNMYHCSLSFKSEEELEAHKLTCNFRTINCLNEGCNFRFSAAQMEQHDQTCPFKIIQCEQNCSESIMRRDMDRHCITVCPMKLVKCPFYSVGCHSSVPQCTIEQHRSESLEVHLICILQLFYKEAKTEDLKERVEELTKLASPEKLAAARDARSLTFAVKDLDAKLGPLKLKTAAKSDDDEVNDLTDEKAASPNKKLSVE